MKLDKGSFTDPSRALFSGRVCLLSPGYQVHVQGPFKPEKPGRACTELHKALGLQQYEAISLNYNPAPKT